MGQVISILSSKKRKAEGAFAAVNIAARRMGYSDTLALLKARDAKDRVLKGKDSPARVVSDAMAMLRLEAPEHRA